MTERRAGQSSRRSPFGDLLEKLRTQRGLTQEGLAGSIKDAHISTRSITNYEKSTTQAKDWVLPHRTGLRLLVQALDLDTVDQHAIVTAWSKSRTIRDAKANQKAADSFIEAGRERSVQVIMDAWHKVQSGIPQVVMIRGVSGIGKTSLARHVSDRIAESTKKVMIAWGGASSWATEVEPYMAVRLATDRMFEEPNNASLIKGTDQSHPKPGPMEIDRIADSIPLIADVLISERTIRGLIAGSEKELASKIESQLGAKFSTEMYGRLDEYCRLLVDLSKSWPIVLVLEDLHWSGDQTSALLMHLTQRLQEMRDTPIMIIGTYRNNEVLRKKNGEEQELTRFIDSVRHSPHVSKVSLNDSLSSPEGMAHIQGVINRTPLASEENANQLAEWLNNQTSGHPLLTGELIRHLIETKALSQQANSTWLFDASRISETTPYAISAFMEQRLSRVGSHALRILDIAAVMNDVILTEIIAAIMNVNEEEILDVIDQELVKTHQLLFPATSVQLLNQSHIAYHFPHALFREHVYSNLTGLRRRNLHLAIAQAMEERYTDADTLALFEITSHYVLAEEWHSAQMAGYRQAQHAVLKLDWDMADMWFKQAEELAIQAQDPVQLWRTRAAILAMLRGTGRYDEAIKLGKRTLEVSIRHNWPTTTALTYHHLGEVYYDLGRIEKAIEHLQKAVALHMEQGAIDLAAAGYSMLSHATYRQGKYDIAHNYARDALSISRDLENTWVQPEAVLAAANCEIDLGYYEDAMHNYQLSTELAVMAGRLHNQYIPPMNIGLCHIFMGNYEDALEVLDDLVATIETRSIPRHKAPPSLYRGYALEAVGRLEEAAEAYAMCAGIRRTDIPQPTLYDAVAGQMRVAILQKDDKAAKQWLAEITTHLETNGWEGIEYPIMVMTSVANACKHYGDEESSRNYIERAHALLMERAPMIENEESRNSYLTNVPMNVEARQLYAELEKENA